MSSTAQTAEGEKILIVDDDPGLSSLLERFFTSKGYRARAVPNVEQMDRLLAREVFNLVVLDLMLPGEDGLSACRRLRAAGNRVPIIMLTAKGDELSRIKGLELGADDYVTKPFSPKALVARVKALLRRLDRNANSPQTQYHYGPLTVDLSRHEVRLEGEEVTLTAKEFGLLEHLLRNVGRVLTRDVLLSAVWGYDYYGTTRTVDVHVRRLKQKLPLLDDAIISIKSLGYKLRESDIPA